MLQAGQGKRARLMRLLGLGRSSAQFKMGYQRLDHLQQPRFPAPGNGSSNTRDHDSPGNGSSTTGDHHHGRGNGSSTTGDHHHGTESRSYSDTTTSHRARERVHKSLKTFENEYLQALPRQLGHMTGERQIRDGNDLFQRCRELARRDSEEAAALMKVDGNSMKGSPSRRSQLSLASVTNVVGKIIQLVQRPVEIVKDYFVGKLVNDSFTTELIQKFVKSADQVKLFCTGLEICIRTEVANQEDSLKNIIHQMDKAKASGFSNQQILQDLLERFSKERHNFMSETLLIKFDALIEVFQKHKLVFKECLRKMEHKHTIATIAMGLSRSLMVCLTVASFICTVLVATLVMAPIGLLGTSLAVGSMGGEILLQLAKAYRDRLHSDSGLVHQLMHGTTIAIDELVHLQEKIQAIKVRLST